MAVLINMWLPPVCSLCPCAKEDGCSCRIAIRQSENDSKRPDWCPILGEVDGKGMTLMAAQHMGLAELGDAMKLTSECEWEEDENSWYHTDCGALAEIHSGTYCPYCGRKVEVLAHESADD